jgi:hypothetical protein
VYSLIFLLILGLIVGILPAGDSIGFFSLVFLAFGFLFRVLLFIIQLIAALILLLFSIPFLVFGKTPPEIANSEPPAIPPLPTGSPLPPVSNEIFIIIRSIILWGVLIFVVLFALLQFFKQHGGIVAALRSSRITNWLLLAWQWLYRNVEKTRGDLSRLVAAGWQSMASRREGKPILPPLRLVLPRSLDPRRQIYFYYLAMIRRGGEQGIPRQPSQTPAEYAAHLEKELPDASQDIDSITDAFIEARYSRREMDSQKANWVKEIWGRIRRALQSKPVGKQ